MVADRGYGPPAAAVAAVAAAAWLCVDDKLSSCRRLITTDHVLCC